MADITRLARLLDGVVAGIDLQSNTPVVLSIKIGGVSNTELTKTILDRLVSTQNGSDLDATYHTHDGQYIKISGATAFTGNQSMGGFRLTNLADPVSAQDAVTLAYMNARLLGLKPKESVRAASEVNVDLATALEDGDTFQGLTLATGDRIGAVGQTAPEDNGIYVVQASGAAVRATDFDSLSPIDEINGAWFAVQEGDNAGKTYVQYGTVATLDTDPINFADYDPIASIIGGDMITKTGATLSVDLATVSGLESSNPGNVGGQLRVKLEASNPSLQINGSNELGAKLDAAGAVVTGASGLSVATDDTTIEKNANALRVKDAGISTAKLAADSADDTKVRLRNNQYLRARNAANDSDVNIAKVNASDDIEFASLPQAPGDAAVDNDLVNKGYLDDRLSGIVSDAQVETMVAGESYSSGVLVAVRMAQGAETAGRVYKADKDATTDNNFYVVGLTMPGGAVSAGQNLTVYKSGKMTATAHGFTVGLPIYLDAAGALTQTAPATAEHAVVRVGIARDTNTIEVQVSVVYIN